MIKNDQIMWLICFKKWISDIKFLQNHGKLSLSMFFIGFHINRDPKRSENGLKWSKMIKSDRKMIEKWSKIIKKWLICFKKWISDIKILQNHGKLSWSMFFIGFHSDHDPKRSENGLKWSKMIKSDRKMIEKWSKNNQKMINLFQKMNFWYQNPSKSWET